MQTYGIYIIKDSYFDDFPDKNLKQNKGENRPCYYAIKDENELLWFIPMSTRVEKYKKLIAKKEEEKKKCDVFHIINLFGSESVLIIGDLFPVTEDYVERPYTISGKDVILKDKKMIKEINKKFRTVRALIRRGVKLHDKQPDVLSIERKLLETIKQNNN